jgi:hypothetical protein
MIHKTSVNGFGSLKDLAETVGNLRYDALHEFLRHLENKLHEDSGDDHDRGRQKLSTCLFKAGDGLDVVAIQIQQAWKISEPFCGQETDDGG